MAAPGGATRLDLSSGRPLDLSARLHGSPQAWKPASDTSWLHDALAAKLPPTPTTTPSNRCATTWRPGSDTSWLIKRNVPIEVAPLRSPPGVDEFPGAADLEESLGREEASRNAADTVKSCKATSPSTSWASDSEEEEADLVARSDSCLEDRLSDAEDRCAQEVDVGTTATAGPEASWASWASQSDDAEADELEAEYVCEESTDTSAAAMSRGLPLAQCEPRSFDKVQDGADNCGLGFFAPQTYVECNYMQCSAVEPMSIGMFGDMCGYAMPQMPMEIPVVPVPQEQAGRTPLRSAPAFTPASLMAPMGLPQQGRVSAKSVPSKPSCKSTRRVAEIPGAGSTWWSTMSYQRGPADPPRVKVGQCVLVSA